MLAEGRNETFNLTLSVPSSLGPAITAGSNDTAIGVIIDTTSECIKCYQNMNNVLCSAKSWI